MQILLGKVLHSLSDSLLDVVAGCERILLLLEDADLVCYLGDGPGTEETNLDTLLVSISYNLFKTTESSALYLRTRHFQ